MSIPSASIDALLTLSELASRLPRAVAEIDQRSRALMRDIAAMRAAVEPLDERMRKLEREMRAMHRSLAKGMAATEAGMKETAKLQGITNERIGKLGKAVEPLEGGIGQVEQNTSPLPDRIATLERLMSRMLEELTAMRESIEPVASAAEPVARLRERLPGRT